MAPADQENVEIVRRIYELYKAGKIDEALAYCAEGIEWIEPAENPDASARVGREQVDQSQAEWSSTWGSMAIDVQELIPSGDCVLVRLKFSVQGAGSGVPTSFEQCQVLTLRDGKVTRLEMFYDEGEAKRAAGIEPTTTEEIK